MATLLPLAWANELSGHDDGGLRSGSPSHHPPVRLYVINPDFPPARFSDYPLPPVEETRFWQLLDTALDKTQTLTLTENIEQADYRVELLCTGITYCSKLQVNVYSPQRDALASYQLKVRRYPWQSFDLARTASVLGSTLTERVALLQQGGVGSFGIEGSALPLRQSSGAASRKHQTP
ncbi:MAG: hypothetical protein SFZ03_10815 [Candidatus Melainabacteria bacterium]|nr:hypothetical protein [Candidatus Melainabacteria bacterium]